MTDPELDPMSTPSIDSLAEPIGRVVVAWSRLSWVLEELFGHLSGVTNEYVRFVLLERIRDSSLDAVCKSLAAGLRPSDRDAVRGWLRTVGELRTQRNLLLHGTLSDYQTSDDPEWRAGRRRVVLNRDSGWVVHGADDLTEAGLTEFHDRVLAVHMAFFELPQTARPS